VIVVVDYGLGNVRAFLNVYKRLNIPASAGRNAEEIKAATRIILPGVGAFDHAMSLLDASGMRSALEQAVLEREVPALGVCVGMQILAHGSDEGSRPGLGWVPGHVRAFKSVSETAGQPIPHMGWNDVTAVDMELFVGMESGARFYFLHSYFFDCAQKENVAATASYGIDFACAVRSKNVYGVQFHPEKSHHDGVALLKNFAGL